jgi:hypothetical protein
VGVVTPLGAYIHEAVIGGRKQQGCLTEIMPAVGLGSRFACAYRLPITCVCVLYAVAAHPLAAISRCGPASSHHVLCSILLART